MKTFLCAFALTLGVLDPAVSQQTPAEKSVATRAEVLVLGVYHMANPGHDIFNMQADDVLAPKRQQEIAQLMEVLKRFNPTKIAIEADPWHLGWLRQDFAGDPDLRLHKLAEFAR